MQPLNPQQVQAYLQHLGTHAPLRVDRAILDRLIAAQMQRVPFENIDVLLQRPILLDADAVFAKVIERGRGGYCFEINSLFARLLLSFGYPVSLLSARVRRGLPCDASTTMLSHLLLRVEVSTDSFIVDIGFGGPTPPCALPLLERAGLTDCPYQLQPPSQEDPFYQLQALQNGKWQTMYQFNLQPQPWVDYIALNWYTSTHPNSLFLSTLMCARSTSDQRLSLFNCDFSRRYADGRIEQQSIDSTTKLIELLHHEFGLKLDPVNDCEPLRQRLHKLLQI
ncbi:arylamine N-acetyltransferase family protein [Pseudomonas peli]|uniref:arylamine N-acetyltransferase family protein n=1 Tax=Pseudomonas peli TaxID=592361 RepID=UPI0024AE7483|nr:arylamine N-acetyltransferase [Pseudomonas peli]